MNLSLSVCNWPQQVAGCGAPEPPVEEFTSPPAPDTTPADTTPSTTASTAVTFRPAAGSPFQCSEPGPAKDSDHCNKFWLCREQTEGSGVLEVRAERKSITLSDSD